MTKADLFDWYDWYNTMDVKLDEGAKLPSRAHANDAGYDLYSRDEVMLPPHGWHVFDTGVHINLQPGRAGMIKSRSGMNTKHGITAEGVIDASYHGSIRVALYNRSNEYYLVDKGDRIAQLVIVPVYTPELRLLKPNEEFGDSDRGDNGFGSTGK